MYACFPVRSMDADLHNLALNLEQTQAQIVYSPACDPGIKNDDTFFINLHALRDSIDIVLKQVEFCER